MEADGQQLSRKAHSYRHHVRFVPATTGDLEPWRQEENAKGKGGPLSGEEAVSIYQGVLSLPPTKNGESTTLPSAPPKQKKHTHLQVATTQAPKQSNPLDLAPRLLRASQEGALDVIQSCLSVSISLVDVRDDYGWTALMCAACEGHLHVVRYLLERGADPAITDNKGQNASEIARKSRKHGAHIVSDLIYAHVQRWKKRDAHGGKVKEEVVVHEHDLRSRTKTAVKEEGGMETANGGGSRWDGIDSEGEGEGEEDEAVNRGDTKRRRVGTENGKHGGSLSERMSRESNVVHIKEEPGSENGTKRAKTGKGDTRGRAGKEETRRCDVCKTDVTISQWQKHLASTLHNFGVKRETVHIIPGSAKNPGYKILKKEGWEEGTGLGKEGEGRRNPIATVLKRDRAGIGVKNGDVSKAKVTHFQAGDIRAVEDVKKKNVFGGVTKRELMKKEKKEKNWERDMRRYMNE